jgi:hypothetical protein
MYSGLIRTTVSHSISPLFILIYFHSFLDLTNHFLQVSKQMCKIIFFIIFKQPVAARKNDVLFIFSLHTTLFYINKNCVLFISNSVACRLKINNISLFFRQYRLHLIMCLYLRILKIRAFWDVAPCSLLEGDRSFRCAYCLHHQGGPNDGGSTRL